MSSNFNSANVVSIIVVLGFVLVIPLLLWHPVDLPASITTLLQVLFGVLSSRFGTVVDYHLGSSAGSRHGHY